MTRWRPNVRLGKALERSGDEEMAPVPSPIPFTENDVRTSNGTMVPISTNSITVENHDLPSPVTQSALVTTNNCRNHNLAKRFGGFRFYWAKFKKRIGTGTAPSSSSLIVESAAEHAHSRRMTEQDEEGNNDSVVEEVVVDRTWTDNMQSSAFSECVHTLEKSPSQLHIQISVETASIVHVGFWGLCKPLAIIRWRTWPFLMDVFSSRFADEKTERHYAQVRYLR